ncbi:hypothetical protein [Janibacter cremeus]|uniref:Uncharacterized protein n=1 Tax=Janibacter cremeus TaxID=1285192 RepID=A0A852VRD3_9MICO|nr:hypothetical protein [Janibacter cremeus]NYF99502.1 hypothetical protein [Janibacter cremeus]
MNLRHLLDRLRRLGQRLRDLLRRLRRSPTDSHESGAVIPLRPDSTDVPQGLAWDEEHEEFVYTFYDADDHTAGRVVFADRDGRVSAQAPLSGLGHYGGITLHGGRTYVCGAGAVQVHATQRLRQGIGEPLMTVRVRASSTVTSHQDGLYVTTFRRDRPERMYRYDLDQDGTPVETGAVFTVPPQTQGVAFAPDGTVYFSRSWGRSRPSVLTRVEAADLAADGGWTAQNGRDTPLPPMAEGSVVVDGRLHQLYESGAAPYRRYQRAHGLLSLLRGPLAPRERLTAHDVGGSQTRGTHAQGPP